MSDDSRAEGTVPSETVSDAYYRHLFENAGIAMISVDNELIIRTWNGTASKMFGASSTLMVGASFRSVIPQSWREEGERVILDTIRQGNVNHLEFQHRDDAGGPRTLTATFSPIVQDQGDRVGALACIRDITRRINLEAEIAYRNKMISLGRMAGGLAHHFNNILGGVVTSVDFALAADDPVLQNRALLQTSEALARAGRLINSLITFAEGDQRHQAKRDLAELIHSVVDYMKPEMASQGVDLEVDLSELPQICVPEAQIVTVIENILHNAVDAMPDGGKATVVASMRDSAPSLSITDTGCGMAPEDLQQIFEPFYSTKGSQGMDFEHHPGLGLAVARGILQVLGYSISIDSEPGESTTVTVQFPPLPVGKN